MQYAIPLTILLNIAAVASGENGIPNTPAGHALSSWLEAFNSGDRARVVTYYEKYQPDQKGRIDSLMGFRDQTGGLSLIRIEKSEPLHVEALVKEREGATFAIVKVDV